MPLIYAECNSTQIDINTASVSELDKLYGIGPAKAEAIISSRTFNSVGDLVKVNGIGDITLQKIKEQGLACVEKEEINENINPEKETEPEIEETEEKNETAEKKTEGKQEENAEEIKETINNSHLEMNTTERNIIVLSSKDIKINKNSSNQDKNTKAVYGLIIFCILLVFLFFIKNKRRNGIE
jgi:competence ComEA-like helix-hairpin-helix protein